MRSLNSFSYFSFSNWYVHLLTNILETSGPFFCHTKIIYGLCNQSECCNFFFPSFFVSDSFIRKFVHRCTNFVEMSVRTRLKGHIMTDMQTKNSNACFDKSPLMFNTRSLSKYDATFFRRFFHHSVISIRIFFGNRFNNRAKRTRAHTHLRK